MSSERNKAVVSIFEICIFGMYASVMFILKKLLEVLPNIHLVGVMIVAITVVYRVKALFPIYTYVFLDGLFAGFSSWWIPYLYIWTILWAIIMLLPKKLSPKLAFVLYTIACTLHGLLFGILYAPAQALMFGLNFSQTLAWIAAGFYFDIKHAIGNFVGSIIFLMPIIRVLKLGIKQQ